MDDRRFSPRIAWQIDGALIALPVLYVLSIGPMLWLSEKGFLKGATYKTFDKWYGPLGWLNDKLPGFGRALNWYADLWFPKVYGRGSADDPDRIK
jgi:hypothetical protein